MYLGDFSPKMILFFLEFRIFLPAIEAGHGCEDGVIDDFLVIFVPCHHQQSIHFKGETHILFSLKPLLLDEVLPHRMFSLDDVANFLQVPIPLVIGGLNRIQYGTDGRMLPLDLHVVLPEGE
jgi:hypothetical protein